MVSTPAEEDEFTELFDADIGRVDLVDQAANGTTFLIAKGQSGAGLMSPDLVRNLIGKTQPQAAAGPVREQVTVTGSPAAIMQLMYEAAVAKAKYDADDLKRMAGNGQAMDDQSYPIADREDLTRAIRAVGRGGADHDAIRRHILSRAKALGATSEIPDNWNADGSLKGSVAKETSTMADDATDLDPTIPLAEPAGDAPGQPTVPGSPAWEAVDAATARKWTGILARAMHAVSLLAEREMIEAASADPDDAFAAMDLEDACCAIEYAISVLAPFAVAEQAEADCAADMDSVGKALAGFDAGALDVIESLGAVRKAGRVLSTTNEAAIRGAVEQLQKVLASLPAAPTIEDSGQPVAKQEDPVADTATTQTITDPAADDVTKGADAPVVDAPAAAEPPAEAVAKAKPQTAIYDKNGRLMGIVDPSSITPVDDGGDDAEPVEAAAMEPIAEAAAEPMAEPVAESAAPPELDLEPAPADEVGTPSDAVPDDVTKTTDPTTDTSSDAVLKSIAKDAAEAAVAGFSATQGQTIAQLTETVATLKGRLEALEEQPAMPKVFANGATPGSGAVPPPQPALRGQDQGAPPMDIAKAQQLKKGLYGAADATEQNAIATDMQSAAIAALGLVHRGGSVPQ